jgi:hypothetical protein
MHNMIPPDAHAQNGTAKKIHLAMLGHCVHSVAGQWKVYWGIKKKLLETLHTYSPIQKRAEVNHTNGCVSLKIIKLDFIHLRSLGAKLFYIVHGAGHQYFYLDREKVSTSKLFGNDTPLKVKNAQNDRLFTTTRDVVFTQNIGLLDLTVSKMSHNPTL